MATAIARSRSAPMLGAVSGTRRRGRVTGAPCRGGADLDWVAQMALAARRYSGKRESTTPLGALDDVAREVRGRGGNDCGRMTSIFVAIEFGSAHEKSLCRWRKRLAARSLCPPRRSDIFGHRRERTLETEAGSARLPEKCGVYFPWSSKIRAPPPLPIASPSCPDFLGSAIVRRELATISLIASPWQTKSYNRGTIRDSVRGRT